MKIAINVLALMAMLSLTNLVKAQDATTKPAVIRGKVQSVDGMVITIKNKKGETTITTDANTTFTLDNKPATLADVTAGEVVVSVTPTDGSVATAVKLKSGKKKHKAPTSAPADGAAN